MITITYRRPNESAFEIEIKGHAGYEDKGKDIVCAAVSVLYYTLVQRLEEVSEPEKVRWSALDGHGKVKAELDSEEKKHILDTILAGFHMLEKNFKKNVTFFELVENFPPLT